MTPTQDIWRPLLSVHDGTTNTRDPRRRGSSPQYAFSATGLAGASNVEITSVDLLPFLAKTQGHSFQRILRRSPQIGLATAVLNREPSSNACAITAGLSVNFGDHGVVVQHFSVRMMPTACHVGREKLKDESKVPKDSAHRGTRVQTFLWSAPRRDVRIPTQLPCTVSTFFVRTKRGADLWRNIVEPTSVTRTHSWASGGVTNGKSNHTVGFPEVRNNNFSQCQICHLEASQKENKKQNSTSVTQRCLERQNMQLVAPPCNLQPTNRTRPFILPRCGRALHRNCSRSMHVIDKPGNRGPFRVCVVDLSSEAARVKFASVV